MTTERPVRDHIRTQLMDGILAVVLDAQTAPFIDLTATSMLGKGSVFTLTLRRAGP